MNRRQLLSLPLAALLARGEAAPAPQATERCDGEYGKLDTDAQALVALRWFEIAWGSAIVPAFPDPCPVQVLLAFMAFAYPGMVFHEQDGSLHVIGCVERTGEMPFVMAYAFDAACYAEDYPQFSAILAAAKAEQGPAGR